MFKEHVNRLYRVDMVVQENCILFKYLVKINDNYNAVLYNNRKLLQQLEITGSDNNVIGNVVLALIVSNIFKHKVIIIY
jgi:hypothetical protein